MHSRAGRQCLASFWLFVYLLGWLGFFGVLNCDHHEEYLDIIWSFLPRKYRTQKTSTRFGYQNKTLKAKQSLFAYYKRREISLFSVKEKHNEETVFQPNWGCIEDTVLRWLVCIRLEGRCQETICRGTLTSHYSTGNWFLKLQRALERRLAMEQRRWIGKRKLDCNTVLKSWGGERANVKHKDKNPSVLSIYCSWISPNPTK